MHFVFFWPFGLLVFGLPGLEHTSILGKTLAEVTRQKAGIFKPGVAAVALPQKEEARAVLVSCANELQVPLAQAPPPALDSPLTRP